MRSYFVFLIAIGAGLSYALISRVIFGLDLHWLSYGPGEGLVSMMTFAFVFVVPFAAGFVTGFVSKPDTSIVYYIFAPWLTLSLVLFFSFIFVFFILI